MTNFADLKDKRIAILWFGKEGRSTFRFLLDHNIHCDNITILDANRDLDFPEEARSLRGEDYLKDIASYDIIFKSSGVPIIKEMLPYKEKIVTQVQLFFDTYPGKVIAITASKGKSTISSLVYTLLINAGYHTKLVGNIGTPIFDEVAICDADYCPISDHDFVVVELSSYMLQDLQKHNYISILWRIFPEHLDWHGSFDRYVAAKLNILPGSEIVIVQENTFAQYPQYMHAQSIPYGKGSEYTWEGDMFVKKRTPIFSTTERKIPGDHNLENITAIFALADVLNISDEILHETVKNFKWLEHRLEDVGNFWGIHRYDDAISTTPESTIEAIKTFGEKVDTIFLWWTDRGYDFSLLVEYLYTKHINNIVLFSPSGRRIQESLSLYAKTHNDTSWFEQLNIFHTDDMKEAVAFAYKHTQQGKICLLSTASPSYSIRKDFEEKGNFFQWYIKELSNTKSQ